MGRLLFIHVLQLLQGLVFLSVILLADITKAFIVLQPIDLPSIEFYTVDILRQAALPSDLDNTLSIGDSFVLAFLLWGIYEETRANTIILRLRTVFSEAFAGAVGAYASRRTVSHSSITTTVITLILLLILKVKADIMKSMILV